MKWLIAAALLFLGMATAQAAVSGNDLKAYCSNRKDTSAYIMCLGYVRGASDTIEAYKQMSFTPGLVCMPGDVTVGQETAVVQKYLSDHPEELHYAASSLILEALGKAFPCQKNSN